MILVDTNVWSELTKVAPNARVQSWERANADRLWLATVVIGELLSGAWLMPDGRRKQTFLDSYEELMTLHNDRIAPFDLTAAKEYGPVLAFQHKAGRDPGTADTQIAAIALTRGMSLATHNTRHFAGLGIELIDPWTA